MRDCLPLLRLCTLLIAFWAAAASAQNGTVPLTDGANLGLYDGNNLVPADHDAAGRARAAEITPRDRDGLPAADGKIVLLSIGMSNPSMEWCGTRSNCVVPVGDSLMGRAARSGDVNHATLAIVNGADEGLTGTQWTSPAFPAYDMVRDARLAPADLTEMQVQAVWLKLANEFPTIGLPSPNADAYQLEEELGSTVRALRVRYPNLKMVFLASRIYAGYAPPLSLNNEPFAYQSGFAVKWLIAAQIAQMSNGGVPVDARAGDLNYGTVAPWIAWGPYQWANGTTPRSDGLSWIPSDFGDDLTHPSGDGIAKVGHYLMDYFAGSPYTKCWFTVGALGCGTPPRPPVTHDLSGDGKSDIVWRNAGTGDDYLYQMNGLAIATEGNLRNVPLPWTIAGVGDFDGDGKADILWRNMSTGDTYLFLMNGMTVVSEAYGRNVPLDWAVAGIGDLNGDGKADIVWRNASTGDNYVYFMNGLAIASEGYLPNVPSPWTIATLGDFDGDGKADIYWRNTGTGDTYFYLLNGLTVASEGYGRNVPTSWSLIGAGDYNGDGKADLLWRNASTGDNYLYLLNGMSLVGEGYVRNVPAPWTIVGTGDYDGDGKADILWRNSATGEDYLFLMNGLGITSEGYLPTVLTDWTVVQ